MALLELQHLTKNFGGLKAVNSLDLQIDSGEIVGLIGPNGAGKTTVFNLISGVINPSSGCVLFKGKEITGLKPHRVAQKGLVRTFQINTVFDELSVLDNIRLGGHFNSGIGFWGGLCNTAVTCSRKDQLTEKAVELAGFIGLRNRQDELAQNLSHGHQRLLGIAVALAADPDLLLLDEPVAGMSREETSEMMSVILRTRERGVTVLLVEHDMKLVMDICQRLCVINFGTKIAEGHPKEICRNTEVIEAYLGRTYAAGG